MGPGFLFDSFVVVVVLLFVWGLVFYFTLNQAATSQARVKVYLSGRKVEFILVSFLSLTSLLLPFLCF